MVTTARNAGAGLVERMTTLARSALVPSAGGRMAVVVVMKTARKGMMDTTRGAARKRPFWMVTARFQMTYLQDPERVADVSGTDQGGVGVAVRVRKEVDTESHRGDVFVEVETIAQSIAARMTMNRIGEAVEGTVIALAVDGTGVDQTAATKATQKSAQRRSGKIDVRVMGATVEKVMEIERRAAGIRPRTAKSLSMLAFCT
jgi:hypothetical protein